MKPTPSPVPALTAIAGLWALAAAPLSRAEEAPDSDKARFIGGQTGTLPPVEVRSEAGEGTARGGAGYRFTVTNGSARVPVAVVGDTPYQMGWQVGRLMKEEMMALACQIPIKGGNVLNAVFDATALRVWASYAGGEDEAYQRPFVFLDLPLLDGDADGRPDLEEGAQDRNLNGRPDFLDADATAAR